MFKSLKSLLAAPPARYKQEFLRVVYGENHSRLLLSTVLLIAAEAAIYFLLQGRLWHVETAILIYLGTSLVFLAVLSALKAKPALLPRTACHGIQLAYLVVLMVFGCFLSLIPQREFATMNTYEIAVFGTACFFVLGPGESFLLFFSVYSGFFLTLPLFQPASDIVLVLRINAFVMTCLAWVLSRLAFRLRLASFLDKKIIEEQNQELKALTVRDSMTSLLNHENCFQELGKEIERAKRYGRPLSIIMMDIDNFKTINDRFGHQVGDEVIVTIARTIASVCRITDLAGRYGGEEYLLIMPNTGIHEAAVVAERIRSTIEGTEFENGIRVTISGGISELLGESPDSLLENADKKLYRAKALGKNRFMTEL